MLRAQLANCASWVHLGAALRLLGPYYSTEVTPVFTAVRVVATALEVRAPI